MSPWIKYWTLFYSTLLCSTLSYYTVLYFFSKFLIFCFIVLYCIALHYIVLHCFVLCCTILRCTAFHCIAYLNYFGSKFSSEICGILSKPDDKISIKIVVFKGWLIRIEISLFLPHRITFLSSFSLLFSRNGCY